MINRWLSLLVIVVLTACASESSVQKTSFHKNCCNSLSEATFDTYKSGSMVLLTLDDKASEFSFSTGKSRFVGLQLESVANEEMIMEAVIEYSGIWLPAATIFVPRFAFLNETFNEIASVEPDFYQGAGKLYTPTLIRDEFYGACLVPKGAKYVVIYADYSVLNGRTVHYLSPGSMGASVFLERAEEVYKNIDAREYALGHVKHLPSHLGGFESFDISRKARGQVRVAINKLKQD